MKIIETLLIFNHKKYPKEMLQNQTIRTGYIDDRIIPVSLKIAQCGFDIVFEHTVKFLMNDELRCRPTNTHE